MAEFSSLHPNDPVTVDLGAFHSHERFIKGTVNLTRSSYYQAKQLIVKKIVNPRPLLDRIFPYQEMVAAFEYALRPETLKTMISLD